MWSTLNYLVVVEMCYKNQCSLPFITHYLHCSRNELGQKCAVKARRACCCVSQVTCRLVHSFFPPQLKVMGLGGGWRRHNLNQGANMAARWKLSLKIDCIPNASQDAGTWSLWSDDTTMHQIILFLGCHRNAECWVGSVEAVLFQQQYWSGIT